MYRTRNTATDANAGMVEKPEEGAVFEVYLTSAGSYENSKESERDILTTDADGFAASKDMPYGRYNTVHQTAGEDDKAFVPDFTVFISENGKTYSYILNNDAITARVRVEKRDAETGRSFLWPVRASVLRTLPPANLSARKSTIPTLKPLKHAI